MPCDRCVRYGNDLDALGVKHLPEDCPEKATDSMFPPRRPPEPTPTNRDLELAQQILESSTAPERLAPKDYFPLGAKIGEALAQRFREGREEGRRQYGFQEGQRVGLETAIRELKRLTTDLEKRALPLRRLPNQPAPGAKE